MSNKRGKKREFEDYSDFELSEEIETNGWELSDEEQWQDELDPEVAALMDEYFTDKQPTRRGENRKTSEHKVVKKSEIPTKSYNVEQPTTLLAFLFEKMSDKSKTTVKSYLKHRQIYIGHTITTQFDAPLKVGDKVTFNPNQAEEGFRHPMLKIVYEDEHLLVVDKRNGLLSMATDRERTKTAYYILSEYLKSKNSTNRIFIIHRLDRETSGLMLFAKSIDIQHTMQKNWNDIVLERKYVAVVKGKPKEDEGVIESYLAENSAFMVYSTKDSTKGEKAITNYKVLKHGKKGASLVELELETGKKNQIRVHMKDLGCPIMGDRKYGGPSTFINRIALHARKIRFIHPITKEEMNFETVIPYSFLKLM